MRIAIVGAGGHGQVVADILREMERAGGSETPVAFVDGDPALHGRTIAGLEVRSDLNELDGDLDAVIVAIGDNKRRYDLLEQYGKDGLTLANAIHPAAVIADSVRVGRGVMVCAGAVVNPGAWIGDGAILNTGCTVDHHTTIGRCAHIAPGVNLGGAVEIGNGALLGIGATVMPGRSVGDWAVLGAGAVATKDVGSGSTAVGIPAEATP